jgi:hypothetical protein
MTEYVKLYPTLKDKLLFLVSGLIKKEYIVTEVREYKSDVKELKPEGPENTTVEEKFNIPFFDLENSETKSNL